MAAAASTPSDRRPLDRARDVHDGSDSSSQQRSGYYDASYPLSLTALYQPEPVWPSARHLQRIKSESHAKGALTPRSAVMPSEERILRQQRREQHARDKAADMGEPR